MSVLVIILIGDTRPCDTNIDNIKEKFNDPYFIVTTYSSESENENTNMLKALEYSSKGPYSINSIGDKVSLNLWTKLPVIIIKDSSVIMIEKDILKYKIEYLLTNMSDANLFFLCKWNDTCDKYVDVENNTSMKWSFNATSTQAILYKHNTRNYVMRKLRSTKLLFSDLLNVSLSKKKLKGIVFIPNLVEYDINLATSRLDYIKLNQCVSLKESATNDDTITMAWIIIVVLAIVFLAMFLLSYN